MLAEFTNTTGDPVFDETLRQGLAVQLQQSPFLSLVSDERIRRTLPLMNQPADARLTPDVARVVCVRTGSAAVLRGIDCGAWQSVRPRPARHELRDRRHPRRRAGAGGAERRCPEHAQSDGDSVPNASWRIARHHRETLDAARGSDDAVARSAAGLQRRDESGHSSGSATALPLFQRAVAIDPDFAMAHAQVGFRYSVHGRVGARATEHTQGLPAARSGQRRRALLHRHAVRPRLHGQPGTGATDVGNVGRRATRAMRRHTH